MFHLFHYIGSALALTLAGVALARRSDLFVHRIFALGMAVLALEALFNGLSAQAYTVEAAAGWQVWRLRAAALVPGVWLVFGLTFARPDQALLRSGFRWVVVAVFAVPLVLLLPGIGPFFSGEALRLTQGWVLGLGRTGYGFFLAALLSLILILVVLERSLRASVGRQRWQAKFFVLGIGGIAAARLVVASYTLVFRSMNLELEVVSSAAVACAFPLILIALRRAGSLQLDLYFSQKTLFNSLTLIIVGLYFLAIGLATMTLQDALPFPLRSLVIFAALLALLVALLSDRLRMALKGFVSAQFHGARRDYREIWLAFTRRTAAIVEEKPLCAAVARMVSEMFDALSVTVWLRGERGEGAQCGGSTACSPAAAEGLPQSREAVAATLATLAGSQRVVDLEAPGTAAEKALAGDHADFFEAARARYLVPLAAGQEVLGFIAIGDRVQGRPLALEDQNILATIAQQVAASLMNIQLAERLRQGRELAAFQTVSAFFVHDLKNLASKLSLMLQNLPGNFENPEFREDAVRLMGKSVDQIEAICRRLSSLREKLNVNPAPCDLNRLVEAALEGLRPSLNGALETRLGEVPPLPLDAEQIQKVVTNLVLNAREAIGAGGRIQVTTASRNGWAEVCVADNGCGMSQDFVQNALFKPFQTTKKQGTGIGLFQSRMIVEAHGGRIEVESQDKKGSVFRICLLEKPSETSIKRTS